MPAGREVGNHRGELNGAVFGEFLQDVFGDANAVNFADIEFSVGVGHAVRRVQFVRDFADDVGPAVLVFVFEGVDGLAAGADKNPSVLADGDLPGGGNCGGKKVGGDVFGNAELAQDFGAVIRRGGAREVDGNRQQGVAASGGERQRQKNKDENFAGFFHGKTRIVALSAINGSCRFVVPPCPVRQLCLRRRCGVRGAAARGFGLECPERRRGVEQQGRRRTRERPLALASRPAPFRANSGSWCWLACARGRRVERKLYNFFASNANPCRGP